MSFTAEDVCMMSASEFDGSFGNRQDGTCDRDRQIIEAVRQALHATGYQQFQRLQVYYEHGRITLQGDLPTYYLKQVAQTVVMSISAVRDIDNDIQINNGKWRNCVVQREPLILKIRSKWMRHLVVASAHEFVAEQIGYYFSKRGFRVELVADDEECLGKLQHKSPDALILDDGLPTGGAAGVLNRIRIDSFQRLPVVLLTDQPSDQHAAHQWVSRLVKRPTDIETLFDAVNGVVPRRTETGTQNATQSAGWS